jgi:hypothetical protein
MIKRKKKPTIKRKSRIKQSKTAKAARKAKATGYDIHAGKPTGREVQAMHRLQTLTDRYIAEGLTPADARTRAREKLRVNPRRDWRGR